jgi:hypothetical protein
VLYDVNEAIKLVSRQATDTLDRTQYAMTGRIGMAKLRSPDH